MAIRPGWGRRKCSYRLSKQLTQPITNLTGHSVVRKSIIHLFPLILPGRPYHISALYVVDLVKFRRIAAGDRLRGQYQALSQDPNSLSNLDQDLPNNMVHQVPIHSLPQEWLWCETWCGQEGKAAAKNIDLCNNPLTKVGLFKLI